MAIIHGRLEWLSTKPKASLFYWPLIDKTPSDPLTILTAVTETERICNAAGQDITILTSDQQLCRVMVGITWSNPTRCQLLIPHIGGMHWIMNFIGCVGKLMEGSGLNKLMVSAFAGVEKMLIGKKFPMNVRAFHLVVTELLRGFIDNIKDHNEFDLFLKRISEESILSEHWVKKSYATSSADADVYKS